MSKKRLTSNQLRQMWIDFFVSKKHYWVKSSSLVPIDDPSLLWINSGVATLKKYFEGVETPPSNRLVNYQKSLRTNDIDNVGMTTRHHTFFEMLGFFSIGDYFSKNATEFAWEFLTSEKYLNFEKEKLYITVHEEDEETYQNWINCGVKPEHLFKMSSKTNFWDVGKGPSGPNTEIFYDRGIEYDKRGIELVSEDIENDRYIEVLNIVLSKFNNDGNNNYTDLPQKNIDTGAGFERLLSIVQDTPSNFETDLFLPQIEFLNNQTSNKYTFNYKTNDELSKSSKHINFLYKATVDFIRSVAMGISDGVVPSNLGRGYVLRRLLRRVIINLEELKINTDSINNLVDLTIESLKEAYPEMDQNKSSIKKIILKEVELFNTSRQRAIGVLNKNIESEINNNIVNTAFVFKLFETYGLPKEILIRILNERHLTFDENEFDKMLEDFKQQSRDNQNTSNALNQQNTLFIDEKPSIFVGYDELSITSKLINLEIREDNMYLVFEQTPFYSNSGGQVSDLGMIDEVEVIDVMKTKNGTIIHQVHCSDFAQKHFIIGNTYKLNVNKQIRQLTANNHSGTHLLFAALEKLLGVDLPQRGSKLDHQALRFDFSYHQKITEDILIKAEVMVNEWIKAGIKTKISTMSQKDAKNYGAKFLDTAQYGEIVRVVDFPNITIDLCGGTHVKSTSDLEELKITSFETKGSGIYRIGAITTHETIKHYQIQQISSKQELVFEAIKNQFEEVKETVETFISQIENSTTLKSILEEVIEIQQLVKANINKATTIKELDLIQSENIKLLLKIEEKAYQIRLQEIATSNETKIYFDNLNKKVFNNLSKGFLKHHDTNRLLINRDGDEDWTISLIFSKEDFTQVQIDNKSMRERKLLGGGSKQYYQFKGPKQQVEMFIEEVWKF